MNTAGRLLLLCLALGLVFESLGIPVADDVEADRDTDRDEEDPRALEPLETGQATCGSGTCRFGCCRTIDGKQKCRELDCA
uniref:Conotoxin superfamily H n=1 Tax=Conus ermineus TaxID=55423 RepID=A0A346CJC5_CONER|nr:conotoxin precursor superfamily H [Conus ermineus]